MTKHSENVALRGDLRVPAEFLRYERNSFGSFVVLRVNCVEIAYKVEDMEKIK
jgi:hypothetical protein